MSTSLAVFAIGDRFDAARAGAIQAELQALIAKGTRHLRLDLARTSFISSAGLRVLVTLYRELDALQGSLQIVAIHPNAERVIELGGFGSLLQQPDIRTATPPADQYVSASAVMDVHPLPGRGGYRLDVPRSGTRCMVGAAPTGFPIHFGWGSVAQDAGGDPVAVGNFLALHRTLFYQAPEQSTPDYFQASGLLQPVVFPEPDSVLLEGGPSMLMNARPREVSGSGESAECISLAELADTLLAHHRGPVALFGTFRVNAIALPALRRPIADRSGAISRVGAAYRIPCAMLGAANGLQLVVAGVVTMADRIPPVLDRYPSLNLGSCLLYGMALLAHDQARSMVPEAAQVAASIPDTRLLALATPAGPELSGLGLPIVGATVWSAALSTHIG